VCTAATACIVGRHALVFYGACIVVACNLCGRRCIMYGCDRCIRPGFLRFRVICFNKNKVGAVLQIRLLRMVNFLAN
jgi:hypothetical protein